ncbi:hypothetical protein [Anaeromyxobacter diazotrophicus]|uniref:Uncharacterized protein n=1 Tax=Anaeromyxobacter diazotrophicus TaxID=2590199 RepID=A0A7I9VKL0_9BACT|nr:hypothetical protein [Anaeromyxobacter diazotrophicus]GEJ56942.1 hypothetical protein AMYX_16830 [Anaeromyxobacter diazotrophicus]
MSAVATGQQVISGPVATNVFAYEERTRQEVFINVAMASVPRVGEMVQVVNDVTGQQQRYTVKQVLWIPREHKAVLDLHLLAWGS